MRYWTEGLKATAWIFVLGAAMDGCAMTSNTWKEEILLHDGRKVVAQRSQRYGGRSEPGKSGPIQEHSIRFKLPSSNQTITWTSEYGSDLGRTNFNLLAVHVLNAMPYVVASPNLCPSYNKWGRPNPPYVAFKYEGAKWHRIALDALPLEFKTINVLLSIQKAHADEWTRMGLVPAEKVRELNANTEIPEFKTILREPLSNGQITEKCGNRVFYKGHWIVDSPTARAIVDFNRK
jgi:hypothetical protein